MGICLLSFPMLLDKLFAKKVNVNSLMLINWTKRIGNRANNSLSTYVASLP